MDRDSDLPFKDEFEKIIKISDTEVGLRGFIVIHTTHLGPALGATRMFPYPSEDEALHDAKRLALTMTLKCAIAEIPHGGAKGVLIGNPLKDKTPELLKRYAEEVNSLNGSFCTGEDMGLSAEDVYYMQRFSRFFIGAKNKAGDSAPYAALGVFYCMQTVLEYKYGDSRMSNRTVAIKGVGKTGSELARIVIENGGKVIAADVNQKQIEALRSRYPDVQIADADRIHAVKADIFAPCALSDDLNIRSISELGAPIVCGVANNQLEGPKAGDMLFSKGIIYIPDYLANAGGLISVADELGDGGYNKDRVLKKISGLREKCLKVLQASHKEHLATNKVADRIAMQVFSQYV